MNAVDLIRKKRDGARLSAEELGEFVRAYTDGTMPDYQASALLMAFFLRGLDGAEMAALTDAMLHSGDVLDLSDLAGPKVDKHSTGGVGDKISLHLAPAVAACGVYVPMISGRGLGHTGGTLDKLESIPGFRVDLSEARFREVLAACGMSLIGQTARLAPADKKIYALRDVTGTVESIPLIAASIMSKKLAAGIDGLVLDVKVGSGAFMKTAPLARELATTLVDIGRRAGKRCSAFITDMNQPLGRYIGNAVEVEESLDVLEGKGAPDLVELTLALGGEMLLLAGVTPTYEAGRERIAKTLTDGSALDRFRRCVELQGGKLWATRPMRGGNTALAPATGYVEAIDTEGLGLAAIDLGAGRRKKDDPIDPQAWIRIEKKLGERVERGEPLATFAGTNVDDTARIGAAFRIGPEKPPALPLIHEVIR